MVNTQSVISDATEKTLNITPSVLVIARLANITPAKLAKAMLDTEANGSYLVDVTGALVAERYAKALEEEKAAKSK